MKKKTWKLYLNRWSEENFKQLEETAQKMNMRVMEFIRFCVNEKIREMKNKL